MGQSYDAMLNVRVTPNYNAFTPDHLCHSLHQTGFSYFMLNRT